MKKLIWAMEVKNIRAYVLIYDGFALFEVVLACYLLKTKGALLRGLFYFHI